jgi:hypothetical protein
MTNFHNSDTFLNTRCMFIPFEVWLLRQLCDLYAHTHTSSLGCSKGKSFTFIKKLGNGLYWEGKHNKYFHTICDSIYKL